MITGLLIAVAAVALKVTGYLHFTPTEPGSAAFQLTLFGYGITIKKP